MNSSLRDSILDLMLNSQVEAIRYILSLLKSNSNLNLAELEYINYILIQNPDHRRIDTPLYLAGRIRGSGSNRLNNIEVQDSFSFATLEVQESNLGLTYVPSKFVPDLMFDLLSRINRLDENSTLIDIASIYRDFLMIHPFTDGNGRTSRVLLDYMLIKSGFGMLNHSSDTSIIMSQSIEELARNLALGLQN